MTHAPSAPATPLDPADLAAAARQAHDKLCAGEAQAALDAYALLILTDPHNPDLLLGLAEAALGAGAPDVALTSCNALIALAPDTPAAWLVSGRACLALGDSAAARDDLAEAQRRAMASRAPQIADLARRYLALADG